MFQLTQKQTEFLDQYESVASFRHVGGTAKPKITCEIKDKIKGKVWAKVTVSSEFESEALDAAIKAAKPGDKPMTNAEMAEQLAAYREKYGDIDDTKGPKKGETKTSKSGK